MDEDVLKQLYLRDKKSVHDIAHLLHCSEGRINYWLGKYFIQKRSISEAIYTKRNPKGDPFLTQEFHKHQESFLFGLGLGLYWGEGTKMSANQVRLGNTDPHLIKSFILFLQKAYNIDRSRLRFALQIFTDMNQGNEERFWRTFLKVPVRQFYKTINTRSGSIGTYRKKSKHGVLTVYFNNKKLRDILIGEIERIRKVS